MFEQEFTEAILEHSPEPPEEHRNGAKVLLRTIRGSKFPDLMIDGLSENWGKLTRAIRDCPLDVFSTCKDEIQREDKLKRILAGDDFLDENFQNEIARNKDLIRWIKFVIERELMYGDEELNLRSEHDPLRGGLEAVWTFCRDMESATTDWLVEDLMVREGLLVVGGAPKTFKTWILVELMVSLASGTPFLGKWRVPEQVRIGAICGEDSKWSLWTRIRSVCASKGIDPSHTFMWLGWRGQVPDITTSTGLDRLCDMIRSKYIQVLAIDPLYFAIGKGVDHNNMFAMGNVLAEFTSAVQSAGATPVLTHHFRTDAGRKPRKPELSDLAHAGIGQFARQWILMGRREQYSPTQMLHKLWLITGGFSVASENRLNVNMAALPDDLRQWGIEFVTGERSVSDPSADSAATAPMLPSEDSEILLKILREQGPSTTKKIREATGMNPDRVKGAIHPLLTEGKIRTAKIKMNWGKGDRIYPGYELANGSASSSHDG